MIQSVNNTRTAEQEAGSLLENFECANEILTKWCKCLFEEDRISDWTRLTEVSGLVDKNLVKGLEKLQSKNLYLNKEMVANDIQIKFLLAECRNQAMREGRLDLWQELVTVCDLINTNLSFIIQKLKQGKDFGQPID